MRSFEGSPSRNLRAHSRLWFPTLWRCLLFVAGGNLVWETFQLPFYTISNEGTGDELAFAVVHCTGGDLLIAMSALALALILIGTEAWPASRHKRAAALAVAIGIAYTIYNEWLNIVVRKNWAYSDLMPIIPTIDARLSPVAKWVVIPTAGFWWARGTHPSNAKPVTGHPGKFLFRSKTNA